MHSFKSLLVGLQPLEAGEKIWLLCRRQSPVMWVIAGRLVLHPHHWPKKPLSGTLTPVFYCRIKILCCKIQSSLMRGEYMGKAGFLWCWLAGLPLGSQRGTRTLPGTGYCPVKQASKQVWQITLLILTVLNYCLGITCFKSIRFSIYSLGDVENWCRQMSAVPRTLPQSWQLPRSPLPVFTSISPGRFLCAQACSSYRGTTCSC